MVNELLVIWEDTYKKGQLTFWLFLALKHGEKYVEEIQNFIQEFSDKTISYDEQSLYRSLRKFQHLEIVEFTLKPGNSGPERKYYRLTTSGMDLFKKFIERNIFLLNTPNIIKILKS
jgi:PadR family transcriptional regulator PadR